VAIVVLTISSLPIGLIPIDVFLVGQMKNATGIFQPWASDEHVRHHISTTVFCSYIVCYVVITLDIFVVIPAVYFFHKYGEFDRSRRSHSDMITAIGCSSLFLCGLMIVLAIGYFIPIEEISDLDADEEIQFRNLILELDTQKVEDVFAFVLAVVRIIGIALFSAYVAVGMAAGPISQLRGYVDPREKLQRVRSRRLGIEIEITEIQQNQHEGQSSAATLLDGIELASTEQIRLLELEREDLDLREELEQLQNDSSLDCSVNFFLTTVANHHRTFGRRGRFIDFYITLHGQHSTCNVFFGRTFWISDASCASIESTGSLLFNDGKPLPS